MIHINNDEKQMIQNAAETMDNRVCSEPTEYTDADTRAVLHLTVVGASETSALVLTGAEMDHQTALKLFRKVVQAELKNWVPNASQRLLHRAGHALGVRHPVMLSDASDCGAEPGWHALIPDWVGGEIFVRRCVTCCRLFADGTAE